jgi:hypothetical protein
VESSAVNLKPSGLQRMCDLMACQRIIGKQKRI